MKSKDDKKEQVTKEYVLPPTVLDSIIGYIENKEQIIDGEWGSSRSLDKLMQDGCMPELYDELIELRNGE
jgi:hypothetical protein